MATGDQQDIYRRLTGYLPRWFGDAPPLLGALMQGFAHGLSFVYSLIAFAKLQTRIKTATGGWLDMIAADFFGASVFRATNETDTSFLNRIIVNMFRERATRAAVTKVLVDLTGRIPVIIEPKRPLDTGAYGGTDAITVISAQIFRNDWQGNQLLYTNARTNGIGASEVFSANWPTTRATVTQPGTVLTPRSTSAYKIVEDTSASTSHYISRVSAASYSIGDNVCSSALFYAGERSQIRFGFAQAGAFTTSTSCLYDLSAQSAAVVGGSPNSYGIIDLGGGWLRCWINATATAAGTATVQCILASGGSSSYTGDGASGLYIDAVQTERRSGINSGPTSYIVCPTASATTVNDYVLGSNGLVVLASAPAVGAALSWTGNYQSTVQNADVAVSGKIFGTGDGISTSFSLAPKYGYAGGYGVAGAYGSLVHQYQAFVTAYRPVGAGIPYVAGYASSPSGYRTPSRGEYASLSMVQTLVSDADIYAAVASVIPVGTIVWMRISS